MEYGSKFDKYSQNTEEIKRDVEKEKIHSTKVLSDTMCIFAGYFKNV